MTDDIPERVDGGVAVLTLPKVLTAQNCSLLTEALTRHLRDTSVQGFVLTGGQDGFSTGFHPEEKTLVQAGEALGRLTTAIEQSEKPVIAAISGQIVNEGVDLMLCAHARVAQAGATVTMNAIRMGLLPGGGATQRLPRLIGAEACLKLMLNAETWAIDDKRLDGLMNRIVSDEVDAEAIALAQTTRPAPPNDVADPVGFQKALTEARARHPQATKVQDDLITCVEAALLLPLAQGLAFELARFAERCADPNTRLLRHAGMTHARARVDLMAAAASAKPVNRVVAMGRSSETADLAAMALEQGHDVWIEAGSSQMGQAMADLTQKRLRPAFRNSEDVKARLKRDETGAEMETADLVFDTAELTPDPPVALKEGAVWILTSPDVSVADRAEEVQAVGQTLRMRRLSRTNHLVELSAPEGTNEGAIATAHAALSAGGQSVIVTADAPGGLLGGLFCAVARAALVMLVAGKEPKEIENAARHLGFRQGPMQMIDALGAGRSLAQMSRVYEARGASVDPLRLLLDRLDAVTDGDAARARRALVFHAPAGQSFARDPDLGAWLKAWRDKNAHIAPEWPDVALSDAMLAALVSEAARLLQSKTAKRASDIDLAAEKGLLMDARSGGPLIQADLKGLLRLSRSIRALEPVESAVWGREPLIDDMVKNGRAFF